MEEQRARQIVRHALALRVLLPEDVDATGKSAQDPLGLLIELQRRSLLSPDVVDALGELAEAERPAGARKRAPARLMVGAGAKEGDGDTLAPEREEGSDTLAPEREDEAFRLPGSLKDEFQAAASFLLEQESHTLAPEREGEGLLLPGRAGPDASGTLAGDGGTQAGEASGGTLAGLEGGSSGSTLAGEPRVGDGTLDGAEAPPGADDGTLAGGTAGGAELEVSSTIAGLPLPDPVAVPPVRGRKLDLGLVSEKLRRRLEEAALARAVVQEGKAIPKQVLEAQQRARQRKVRLGEQLLQDGVLDPAGLKSLSRQLQGVQRVCSACLTPFPAALGEGAECPRCGHATQAGAEAAPGSRTGTGSGTGTGTAAGRPPSDATGAGTIASSTGGTIQTAQKTSAKGIEGFPGEGGTFANYELIKRVAEGGMGVVFKARERTLNRIVALKVMRGGSLASKVRRRRFLAEAESAAGLHHPSIVPIHQISEVAGYPFYTMDFVDGRPLDEWVKRSQARPEQVAGLMRAVADAVHHFHLRGIIHRDLKPDNILVTDEGEPKIIDFGIAKKITSDLDTDASWTVEGEVLGTPHYMPPEQAAGRVQEVDTRSDVYALGAILYKLLAGKAPFAGLPVARVVLAIQDDDPTPLSSFDRDLDRDLEAIVGKAMSKERERRYQSALELAQDLQRFLEQEPVQARPASLGYRARKFVRKHRAAVVASAVVLALVLGVSIQQAAAARARAGRVAQLLEDARRAPLRDRPQLFAAILGQDPDNALARVEQDKAESELRAEAEASRAEEQARRAEDERRLADQRIKAEQAQAALAAELQQREMRELQAREKARAEAEDKARQEAARRAEALLARAQAAQDPLTAVGLLTDALALVPEQEETPLSGRLAGSTVPAGLPDVLVACAGDNSLTFYIQTAAAGAPDTTPGTFHGVRVALSSLYTQVGATGVPAGDVRGVAIGDLNGDGANDFVVVHQLSRLCLVFVYDPGSGGPLSLNSGNAAYIPGSFPAGLLPFRLALAWQLPAIQCGRPAIRDVTGDGQADLLVPQRLGNEVLVYTNRGNQAAQAGLGQSTPTPLFGAGGTPLPPTPSPFSFTTSFQPFEVTVQDVNGDRRDDVLTPCGLSFDVSIFLQTTPGSLDRFIPVPAGGSPFLMETADLTQDGGPDLAVTMNNDNAVFVFQRAGGGSLLSRTHSFDVDGPTGVRTDPLTGSTTTPSTPFGVSVKDATGDGRPDIIAAVQVLTQVSPSGPTRGGLIMIPGGPLAADIALVRSSSFAPIGFDPDAGDVIGPGAPDGIPDLVLSTNQGTGFNIYQGLGNGTFANVPVSVSAGSGTQVTVVDLNGDGFQDIVCGSGNFTVGTRVFYGRSDGATPAASVNIQDNALGNPVGLFVADVGGPLDSMGQPMLDLIVTGFTLQSGGIFYQTNPGSRTPPDMGGFVAPTFVGVPLTVGGEPAQVAVGDLNSDGRTDLAIPWGRDNLLAVYYRNPSPTGLSDTFFGPALFPTANSPIGCAILDVDGDGRNDVVVSARGANALNVFLQR